jgi:lysophospholipase L1-like esterase
MTPTSQPAPHKPTVLIIGDSISMESIGYFDKLNERLSGRYELVHNPGNGGDTRNVLGHLDEWVTAYKPDIIHFNCGLHDLRTNFDETKQQVPPEEYEHNLQEIVNYLKTRTKARLVFALSTPTNEQWHKSKGTDRLKVNVDLYNEIARRVMTQNKITINDLHSLVVHAGVNDCLVPDGVHMNENGKTLCADAVAAAIERAAKIKR